MKPLVIYHSHCLDGFGAAFAAWLSLGDDAEYVPMAYNQAITADLDGRKVYILDFSFPKPVMDVIFAKASHVVWLDHHKTAFEHWLGAMPENGWYGNDQPGSFIRLDNSQSGALLAWNYFHGGNAPELFKHIDDYDRWVKKMRGTEEIVKGLWSMAPWNFIQWKSWLHREDSLDDLMGDGAAILRAHRQLVADTVKYASMPAKFTVPNIGMFNGLMANCPPNLHSDVGHDLATASGTFGLCWNLQNDGRVKCGLRSNGDYDVSYLAKGFGGGGHKNAAGFYTDLPTLMEWLR